MADETRTEVEMCYYVRDTEASARIARETEYAYLERDLQRQSDDLTVAA